MPKGEGLDGKCNALLLKELLYCIAVLIRPLVSISNLSCNDNTSSRPGSPLLP